LITLRLAIQPEAALTAIDTAGQQVLSGLPPTCKPFSAEHYFQLHLLPGGRAEDRGPCCRVLFPAMLADASIPNSPQAVPDGYRVPHLALGGLVSLLVGPVSDLFEGAASKQFASHLAKYGSFCLIYLHIASLVAEASTTTVRLAVSSPLVLRDSRSAKWLPNEAYHLGSEDNIDVVPFNELDQPLEIETLFLGIRRCAGRVASRSCARTAMRRTSTRQSSCTGTALRLTGRGIRCVTLDYDAMRGIEREDTLF
jgi:hypothetical protein